MFPFRISIFRKQKTDTFPYVPHLPQQQGTYTHKIDSSEMLKTIIIKLGGVCYGHPSEICLFRNLFISANYYTKLIIISHMFIRMLCTCVFSFTRAIVYLRTITLICVRQFVQRGQCPRYTHTNKFVSYEWIFRCSNRRMGDGNERHGIINLYRRMYCVYFVFHRNWNILHRAL